MKLDELKIVGANASAIVAAIPVIPPMAPEQEEPETPEAPAAPVEEPPMPKYKAGDRVKVGDEVGVVEGEAMPECYAYSVKCGEKVRIAAEQGMEPSEDEPMMDDAPVIPAEPVAPAALSSLLGLAAGASMTDVMCAVHGLIQENDALAGDKMGALQAAGVKADVADFAAQALTRPSGKTWVQAVDALRASRPSLFEAAAPVAEAKEVKDAPIAAKLPPILNGVQVVKGPDNPAPAKAASRAVKMN